MLDLLRNHIETVRALPGAARAIRQQIEQLPAVTTGEQVDQCERALNTAIDAVPRIVEDLSAAAHHAGITHLVAPILQQVTDYFLTEDDLLPDHEGTLGLLDDAYLAHLYLQEVNRAYRASAGQPLIAIDLSGTVAVLRAILGPDVTGQLDQVVALGVQNAVQLSAFQQMLQGAYTLDRSGGPGSWGNAWEDEIARVGAEIGISINW